MKPKVGIGITTYEDIQSPDFGLAMYEALVACSPKLAPYRVEVIGKKYEVRNAQDFASHWSTELRLVARPKYGVAPAYTPPSVFGASWRTKGSLSGDGDVHFGVANSPSTVTLQYNYAAKPAWDYLFRQLIDLFKPSQANLHIFTERELELAGEGSFAFRAPLSGEGAFTAWKSDLGSIRGPDPWEVAERRSYRFLPELAWGNFLGDEFAGRFDRALLLEASTGSEELNNGILFHVTKKLDDVINQPGIFEGERARMHTAFADDFFRSD